MRFPLTLTWLARGIAVFWVVMGAWLSLPREFESVREQANVLRLWPDAAAQSRALLGAELYDALASADAMLPRRASVLLVTRGKPPRGEEYSVFHRLLYHLAPRPVWWTNPAPPDGTWESRWWIQSSITAQAIRALAQDKQSSYVIFYRLEPPPELGAPIALSDSVQLITLAGQVNRQSGPAPVEELNVGGLIAGVLVIVALGGLVVTVAARLGYRAVQIESIALAWMLGAGIVSVAMLWLNALGLSLRKQIGVITILTVLGWSLILVLRLKRRREPNAAETPGTAAPKAKWLPLVNVLLIILIVLQIAFVGVIAAGRPLLIWDSWVNWAMKARIIYREGSISPSVYADPSRTVTQLDYPLLVPLVETWTFAWAGSADDWLAGIQSVLFFAALLGLCYGALVRLQVGSTWALVGTAALAAIPSLGGMAALVFADFQLAAFAALASLYLVGWLENKNPGALLIAALGAGLLAWTKREGLVLLIVLCVAILLTNGRSRRAWIAVGAFAISSLFLSGAWWIFISQQGIRNVAFGPITLTALQTNLSRLPVIRALAWPFLLSSDWSYVLPLGVVALLITARSQPRAVYLPLTALLYLGAMSLTFVFSDYAPYQAHVMSSFGRLIAHVAPLPVLFTILAGRTKPRAISARRLPTC